MYLDQNIIGLLYGANTEKQLEAIQLMYYASLVDVIFDYLTQYLKVGEAVSLDMDKFNQQKQSSQSLDDMMVLIKELNREAESNELFREGLNTAVSKFHQSIFEDRVPSLKVGEQEDLLDYLKELEWINEESLAMFSIYLNNVKSPSPLPLDQLASEVATAMSQVDDDDLSILGETDKSAIAGEEISLEDALDEASDYMDPTLDSDTDADTLEELRGE